MLTEHFRTANLKSWLARARDGDRTARNDLLRACQGRLEHLVRKMLRGYPGVARWAQTGDVFQNAALRLLRALEATDVADTREFFNLAASVIRRELIDLARHFYGPLGIGTNHSSRSSIASAPDPAGVDPDPEELDQWAALHEAVEKLPARNREIFGLVFYHGWTQEQIAEFLDVCARTVRRRLRAAEVELHRTLGGKLPPSGEAP